MNAPEFTKAPPDAVAVAGVVVIVIIIAVDHRRTPI
jgi:hypothetical protein